MSPNNADKFTTSYGTVTEAQCRSCAHWSPYNAEICAAYPDGIPDVIWLNKYDHKWSLPNDKGIRWAPRPEGEL